MNGRRLIMLVIGVVVLMLGVAATFIVDERQRAIVFRFGEIVRADLEPGLHFKWPFVNNTRYFDARVQTMDASPELYLTVEKKNLVVDSFVKWRVRDVQAYYTRLQGRKAFARERLAQQVNDSLRREFGKRTVQEVISGDRATIMEVVRQVMDDEVRDLGIEILDVRLKRVDLDPAISQSVYARMQAERERVARELRAQGEEAAERIRADADRERRVLLANAQRDAEQVRGQGDAGATTIYAEAYGQNAEFYNLYRSLEAYKSTFNSKQDLIVLDPSSEFFKYFKNRSGRDEDATNGNP